MTPIVMSGGPALANITVRTRSNSYACDANGNVVVTPGASAQWDIQDLEQMGFVFGLDPNTVMDVFGGCNPGTGSQPAAGSAFRSEGNLARYSSAAATGLGANGADTTDDILCGFRIPAGAFDVAGRGVQVTVAGKFGATVNNKRVRLWVGVGTQSGSVLNADNSFQNVGTISAGTATYDSGTQTGNNVGWGLLLQLFKYGAAGSNTQYANVEPIFGTTHGGITLPIALTLVESAVIDIIVTGASQTTGAAADVVANFFEINAMN